MLADEPEKVSREDLATMVIQSEEGSYTIAEVAALRVVHQATVKRTNQELRSQVIALEAQNEDLYDQVQRLRASDGKFGLAGFVCFFGVGGGWIVADVLATRNAPGWFVTFTHLVVVLYLFLMAMGALMLWRNWQQLDHLDRPRWMPLWVWRRIR